MDYKDTFKDLATRLFPEDEALQEQAADFRKDMDRDRKACMKLVDKALSDIKSLKTIIEDISKLKYESYLPSIGEFGGGTEKAIEMMNLLLSCFEKKRVSIIRMMKEGEEPVEEFTPKTVEKKTDGGVVRTTHYGKAKVKVFKPKTAAAKKWHAGKFGKLGPKYGGYMYPSTEEPTHKKEWDKLGLKKGVDYELH